MIPGYPVASFGTSTNVGTYDPDGLITYFIPFSPSASGIYGVDNGGIVGTVSDQGSPGGSLDMYLRFDAVPQCATDIRLKFYFDDLDLLPVNDGGTFREKIQFLGTGGSTNFIDDINDDTASIVVDGNNDSQTIEFTSLSPLGGITSGSPFYVLLRFRTVNANGRNTAEQLRAKLTYVCPAAYTISGTATLQGSNTPLSGVTVTASGQSNKSTNGSGAYSFPNVPNGSYTLAASKPGYVVVSQNFSNPVVVNGGNQPNKNFVLDCADGFARAGNECVAVYSISGRALLQGTNTPVAGVTVSASGITGGKSTAANGSYQFTSVPNGSYSLSASKPGYVVVSTTFSNPVVVNGAAQTERNFLLACADMFALSNGECRPEAKPIVIDASDGTFKDYVLVTWTKDPQAKTCDIYRSEAAGSRGELLVSASAATRFEDTSATPDQRYHYTAVCDNGSISNQDEGWRPGDEDTCQEGEECIFEELDPQACASANGFLGQVNIATVINRFSTPLLFEIAYRDRFGEVKGTASAELAPFQKMDFIVNEMGLELDTYGTVCVEVDTQARGAWSGGVTLYKANTRDGDARFGSDFDFVLYYPFTNPRQGDYTLPLNTFHFGVRQEGTIANWVRITDAERGDGQRLQGSLHYFSESGEEIGVVAVDLPDGGRYDFSGHEGVAGPDNIDQVGMAQFRPKRNKDGSEPKYYISLGRYFYDCVGASCSDFYTAFVVPNRPATDVEISGGVSTVKGEVAILEFNNAGEQLVSAELSPFVRTGALVAQSEIDIPARATRHIIINQSGEQGFFATDTVGSARVKATRGSTSAMSIFYKLSESGVLEYAYAAPLTASPGIVQISEFNSFIGNENTGEFHNTSSEPRTVQVRATDADNNEVLQLEFVLAPRATERIMFDLPKDTYGSITVQSDQGGLVFRNYVSRPGEYVLSFMGQ
ncbi:MAG: carboxypeptidase regulatory-like domain-containing protein [Bdellovibrionales bacterium]|nr:carboxypeptidase regulatory-like domain-containing protein [Bdellovibrionales bacterium]